MILKLTKPLDWHVVMHRFTVIAELSKLYPWSPLGLPVSVTQSVYAHPSGIVVARECSFEDRLL